MTSTNWCMYYMCFCDEIDSVLKTNDEKCNQNCIDCGCVVNLDCDEF